MDKDEDQLKQSEEHQIGLNFVSEWEGGFYLGRTKLSSSDHLLGSDQTLLC